MAASTSQTREERVQELVEYLQTWQAAQLKYWDWIDRQYAKRHAAFIQLRQKQRKKLIAAIKLLKFDSRGRVVVSGGRVSKQRFRVARDRALAKIVAGAKQIYGYAGGYDKSGLFRGGFAFELQDKAVKKLKGLMGEADSSSRSPEGEG